MPIDEGKIRGKIRFSATHCPSWDRMRHVLLSAHITEDGGLGSVGISKEVTTDEARQLASDIIRACEIVDSESGPRCRLCEDSGVVAANFGIDSPSGPSVKPCPGCAP